MADVLNESATHAAMQPALVQKQALFAAMYATPSHLLALSRTNQTQSMLSLVATAGALGEERKRLVMTALLNDLMSSDLNCILSSGKHPDGNQCVAPISTAFVPSFHQKQREREHDGLSSEKKKK